MLNLKLPAMGYGNWLEFDPKRTTVGFRGLEIFGPESGVLGDASKHLGTNFLSVMKCEDEIRPTFAAERAT